MRSKADETFVIVKKNNFSSIQIMPEKYFTVPEFLMNVTAIQIGYVSYVDYIKSR